MCPNRKCFKLSEDLRSDRQLGVKFATLGTVTSLAGSILRVRLEGATGPRTLSVHPQSYKHLDHSYAMKVHKAQRVTVDRALVLASSHFVRHTS